MSSVQEHKIKEEIVNGYLKASALAEASGVMIQDFQLWVSQALLGVFLSVNEVGSTDEMPEEIRMQIFRSSIDGFHHKALELFQDYLKENRKPIILSP